MSISKYLMAVAIAVALGVVSTSAAQARSPHHRHHAFHHHHASHHHRVSHRHRAFHHPRVHHWHYHPVRHPHLFRRIDLRLPVAPNGSNSNLVALAARYVGENPTGRRSLWCADFANLVLRQAHRTGTGSRLAKSFLSFPRTSPHLGAIAVMSRRGGGHVGFVAGFDSNGNPLIISGNSRGHRVSVSTYDRRRILKYVAPV